MCFFYRFRSDIRPLFPSRRLCRLCQNANKTHLKMSLFGLFSAKPAISATCWARQTARKFACFFKKQNKQTASPNNNNNSHGRSPSHGSPKRNSNNSKANKYNNVQQDLFVVEGFRGNDNAGNARLYADSARIPIDKSSRWEPNHGFESCLMHKMNTLHIGHLC